MLVNGFGFGFDFFRGAILSQSYDLTLDLGYNMNTTALRSARISYKIQWHGRQSYLVRQLANMNIASRSMSSSAPGDLPLAGVRVLEMGQLIAGPFGGQLLGYANLPIICICHELNSALHRIASLGRRSSRLSHLVSAIPCVCGESST